MNRKQILLGFLFVDFTAFTVYGVWHHGLVGLFEILLSTPATTLLLADLTISLGLIIAWMYGDARERGISFLPYALLTAAFGSVGSLLYLIRREGRAPASERVAGGIGTVRA
jgi:hypothetical protein